MAQSTGVKKKITIRDIAQMANVSVATVSYVINGKEGVGAETRARIQSIIDQTGFTRNINSRRLIENRSYNICLLIRPSSSPFQDLFYYEVMQGLLETCQQAGYNLIFCHLERDESERFIMPRTVANRDCDGIAIFQDIDHQFLTELKETGVPVVLVDNHSIPHNTDCIRVDNRLLCLRATNYLISQGHKRIGFLGNANLPDFYNASFQGYFDALAAAKMPLNPAWILSEAKDEQKAFADMNHLLSASRLPTSFVCSNDHLAIGAMKAVKAYGMHIPADMSFIGIDDIVLSRYVEPALTTLKIDKVKLGSVAGNLLLKAIDSPGSKGEAHTLEMNEIVERQSIKRLS
ncbi:MAG: LacI family transcriptional regulator [Spirochaetales bacterium]|nr:LacI family transcriptional regulator [Spirochaetales bacterium]